MQVYYNNAWGSICGQTWDKKNADVVCRMLGYLKSSEPSNGADYGKGNGTIWLNSVQCTGTEKSLFSCVHDGWRNHTCTSSNEANVSCIGPDGIILSSSSSSSSSSLSTSSSLSSSSSFSCKGNIAIHI